ncbi:helix-turn-helix domain-containing protein [Gordonia sp. CPCC 205515]|uniref:PucR family transcriptional regulator n=1 Tax=Gordonia sp. CPCC 205515 TaxID=3140791 RepID=UPI003AF388B7
MSAASLDDALQDLSEAAGRRLVVVDWTMAVVGYSIHENEADRLRLSVLLAHAGGWTPPPAAATSDDVYAVFPQVGRCLLIPLTDHRRLVGYLLCVVDDDPLDDAQLQTLRHGAAGLGVLLSLRLLYDEHDRSRARELLIKVIGDDPVQRRAAAEALIAERHIGAAAQYSAVAIEGDPRPGHSPDSSALAVWTTLDFVARSSTASVVGSTLDDGTGILIFPRPVVTDRLARILDDMDVGDVRAGIGPVVGRLEEIHQSVTLARRALRANWLAPADHGRALTSDDAGLDGLLALLPIEQLTVDDLPRSVQTLLAADLSSDIVATLQAYLDCGGDAARTARTLTIQRSTLYYRLGRVRSALDRDLSDGRLRAELQLGLRLHGMQQDWSTR